MPARGEAKTTGPFTLDLMEWLYRKKKKKKGNCHQLLEYIFVAVVAVVSLLLFPLAMLYTPSFSVRVNLYVCPEEVGWVCKDARRCFRTVTLVLQRLAHLAWLVAGYRVPAVFGVMMMMRKRIEANDRFCTHGGLHGGESRTLSLSVCPSREEIKL